MCGLIAVYDSLGQGLDSLDDLVKDSLKRLEHRGPDEHSMVKVGTHAILGHSRLSIVDLHTGTQPLGKDSFWWIHNGEIYNHGELKTDLERDGLGGFLVGQSDSAVIGGLYKRWGVDFCDHLDGVFSLIIADGGDLIVARDPLGVKPLFYGKDKLGRLWFSSEIKGIMDHCGTIETFPPGTLWHSQKGWKTYYRPAYKTQAASLKDSVQCGELLKESLVRATQKRLMADVPVGALLSGGLDSSLVAAIASRELKKQGKKLHTFSIGLDPNTHDLKMARLVARHIGSIHHEVIFTEEEGHAVLKSMIGLLETYDVTTIRASTPMFIMSKVIRDKGIKVVLSGEGADEIFGGYLYFSHAPSAEEFHKECLRRIDRLHTADLLRADRSTMGASVEARVPFLDKAFLEVAMAIDPELKLIGKGRPEKWVLRQAFQEEREEDQLIPDAVLWRQKEQFSDGVGYSWVDGLKELALRSISFDEYQRKEEIFPYQSPLTEEAFYYRKLYSELFLHQDCQKQVKRWIPKWQDYNIDPSGRANAAHQQTYEKKRPRELALVGK